MKQIHQVVSTLSFFCDVKKFYDVKKINRLL